MLISIHLNTSYGVSKKQKAPGRPKRPEQQGKFIVKVLFFFLVQ